MSNINEEDQYGNGGINEEDTNYSEKMIFDAKENKTPVFDSDGKRIVYPTEEQKSKTRFVVLAFYSFAAIMNSAAWINMSPA
jgi:hypothetical protein